MKFKKNFDPLYLITLIGFAGSLFYQHFSNIGHPNFHLFLLPVFGLFLLVYAKIPTLKQKKFFSLGHNDLKGKHQIIYYVAWILIITGLILV